MRRGIVDDGYGRIASAVVKPSSEKKALMEDEYAQDLAEKLVGNWQKFESFGWGSQPEENPENWTIVYTSNRDSGLTDQANAAAIEEIMGQFPEDQVVAESHGHWAVGHVDGYSIRVYEPDGTLTPAFKAWAEIQLRLENYPILDENRLSEMEFEAAVENCKYAVPSRLNSYPNERVQEHWEEVMDSDTAAANFMDWAKDNDPNDMQSSDDQGYYPDDAVIDEWIEEVIVPQMPPPEPGDEDYEEPDPGAEGFATGPNPVDPRQTSLPFKGGRRRAQWVDMGNGHWVNEDTGEHEYEETEEEPSKEPASFEGYGREKNPDPLRQRLPLGTPAPRLPPGFEGFSEEEMSGRGARRRAQAAPQLPTDEEELNPEELEEMSPTPEQQGLEKFNWNDYVWGPFRTKGAPRSAVQKRLEKFDWSGSRSRPAGIWSSSATGRGSRQVESQMSTQDDAIVRMVEQEDARLVKYRGGLALVPIDGYAYPVDEAGAELALAHGAEDYTQPKQRAGAREAGMYKGVSDEGLERLARIFKAQSDPGVSPTGPLPGDEELDEAEAYGEAEERGEKIPPEKVLEKVKNLWDEDTLGHLVSAEGWTDDDGWSIEAQVFVPREEMQDFLQFSEAPGLEEWKDALYEAYDDQPGVEGNPGRWAHTSSVSNVIEESNGIRFTLTWNAFMDI